MTVWLILALMTAAAIFAFIWPLVQNGKAAHSGSDVAVYRDQLAEIERDRAAGLIAENEAAGAQVEVSRRLIAAADQAVPKPRALKSPDACLPRWTRQRRGPRCCRAQSRGTGGQALL